MQIQEMLHLSVNFGVLYSLNSDSRQIVCIIYILCSIICLYWDWKQRSYLSTIFAQLDFKRFSVEIVRTKYETSSHRKMCLAVNSVY